MPHGTTPGGRDYQVDASESATTNHQARAVSRIFSLSVVPRGFVLPWAARRCRAHRGRADLVKPKAGRPGSASVVPGGSGRRARGLVLAGIRTVSRAERVG
jgi:hypothetical protein